MAVVLSAESDGQDHINVYSRGRTLLGRLLSNFAETPFEVPVDGRFKSVEGYWYWLSCRDERLRSLSGYQAKQVGRESRGTSSMHVPDFEDRILLAVNAKLAAHRDIADMLKNSFLPLKHYYEYNGIIRHTNSANFILAHLERCRFALQQGQALPDPLTKDQEPQQDAAKGPGAGQFELF